MQSEKQKNNFTNNINHEKKQIVFGKEDLFAHIRTRYENKQVDIFSIKYPINFLTDLKQYQQLIKDGYSVIFKDELKTRLIIFNR